MNPMIKTDFYKVHHIFMYVKNMIRLNSNFTPRKSRLKGVNHVVFFGMQHFIIQNLIKDFNENFFGPKFKFEEDRQEWKKKVVDEYKRHIQLKDYSHIEALWDLGYLPIEIKALPEGTLCPIGVPCFTIENTHDDFGWLTNYLETLVSAMMWQPITSATIANEYRKLLEHYALETTSSTEGVEWQGHDFSMRGMSSVESAISSGMAHLTSFTGTDCIPAIYQLEKSYKAVGLIGGSVPATEHSVECMNAQGTMEGEYEHTKRLLELYPTGIISKVSDTTDLWKVITEVIPKLKEEILKRDGKLVIRPDSGNPVDILCGTLSPNFKPNSEEYIEYLKPAEKGVVELLWDTFGGHINDQGYKVLDPHIGAIYGDSITLERAEEICERLKAKGFASTNVVLGIGSFTYQYNTRDTFGFAMKATYGEIKHLAEDQTGLAYGIEAREIFKDPITDDGTKKSKKGLLRVDYDENGKIVCYDQQTREQEQQGLLQTVFKDGVLVKETTLEEIRELLRKQ